MCMYVYRRAYLAVLLGLGAFDGALLHQVEGVACRRARVYTKSGLFHLYLCTYTCTLYTRTHLPLPDDVLPVRVGLGRQRARQLGHLNV